MFFHSCWCYLVGDVELLDVRVGGAAGCWKWATGEGPVKVVASFRFLPHPASWSSVTWTLFPHAPTTWDSSRPSPPWWAETFDPGSQNDCLSVACCLRNCPQQIFWRFNIARATKYSTIRTNSRPFEVHHRFSLTTVHEIKIYNIPKLCVRWAISLTCPLGLMLQWAFKSQCQAENA